jgi:hypothetical protein
MSCLARQQLERWQGCRVHAAQRGPRPPWRLRRPHPPRAAAPQSAWMDEFVHRCAHIARKFSIGKSTGGLDIWVLEISDKPGTREPEPSYKFVGNMHGDEPVGRWGHASCAARWLQRHRQAHQQAAVAGKPARAAGGQRAAAQPAPPGHLATKCRRATSACPAPFAPAPPAGPDTLRAARRHP